MSSQGGPGGEENGGSQYAERENNKRDRSEHTERYSNRTASVPNNFPVSVTPEAWAIQFLS